MNEYEESRIFKEKIMKDKKSSALLVLIAAVAINVFNGVMYTWSSISSKIISEWGWTSKEASLPYTTYTVFFVVSMVAFGETMDKKGPKGLATLGSILLGLGFLLSGFTKNPAIMVITIGIIMGSGVGMHTLTTAPAAIKWFPPEKKGLVTGIVSSGVAASSLIFSPIGKYLLDKIGVNNTFILLGGVLMVVTTVFSRMLKNPATQIIAEEPKDSLLDFEVSYDWKYMLKTTYFYKLWIMMAFLSASGLMIISHIVNISKVQAGLDNGYILIIFLSIFNFMGRILAGMFSDKLGRINLLKIILILEAINIGFFRMYSNLGLLIIGVGIVGFCYGAVFSVFPSAISDKYGPKFYGKNYALIFTSWGLSGIIGPMTAAAIFDITGGYEAAYLIALFLLIISSLIAFGIKEKNEQKESLVES
ncbi:OFA family MFS transporter [Tissierella creatinini]|nr:OFA family MFS transporter [Tissierella creatinini]TJX64325.1 OFA family MFS transporter [Soehngenia saccharolytica]